MKKADVNIDYRIKLDAAPHFRLEGTFQFDSTDKDRMKILKEDGEVEIRFLYHDLHTDMKHEGSYIIKISDEITPWEVMREGIFFALKCRLQSSYEDWYDEDKSYDGDRFFVDTIGYCYYHSFQRIIRNGWTQEHMQEETQIKITGKDGINYFVKNSFIYGEDESNLGTLELYPWRPGTRWEARKELYYNWYHHIHADVSSFEEYMEALSGIPEFFRAYHSESWQMKEAAERLRLLGISEKEIRDFEEKKIIPVIESGKNGILRKKFEAGQYKGVGKGGWSYSMEYPLKCLKGGIPYLLFRDKGEIPMYAFLYVEPLISEAQFYRSELKKKKKRLTVSAIVFTTYYENLFEKSCQYEYGSIVIEKTSDGPIRVG